MSSSVVLRESYEVKRVTVHVEPRSQGGATFWRCRECTREPIYGADEILHRPSCPFERD